MPAAIPFIAAAAATSWAVGAGFVVAGSFAASLVGGAAAMGASMLMGRVLGESAPSPASQLNQPGAGRTQQVRQPTPSHEVIVGRIKKSGPIMFMQSMPDDSGRADGYFYIQHALAAHRCQQIDDIYLDETLSTDAKFSGLVRVGRNLGATDQVEDADFLADLGADFADHWLRGRTNICTRLKGSSSAFPNGLPNVSAMVWGIDEIYDPRSGTSGWTNNAILIIAWWMIWGEGYTLTDFDMDTLVASANVCDERVAVKHTVADLTFDATANTFSLLVSRQLDVGDGFRLASAGSLPSNLAADYTYYAIPCAEGAYKVATSSANALGGIFVDINDAGTGPHTLIYWDEARYKCNGSFAIDAQKRDVREQLLTACAGYAVEIGGIWYLHAGAAAMPILALDEDDLRGPMVTVPKRSMRDRFNGVRATFVNPDNAWQPGDAPPLLDTVYVGQDGGEEIYTDIRLPFTTSARCAQRLMKIQLERNRQQRLVRYPAKLTAMGLRPLDGCYISNARYGWLSEQHIVMGWVLADDGGIDLSLQQDSASVYAWTADDEKDMASFQSATLPDQSVLSAPSNLTATTPTTPVYSRLDVDWDVVSSLWIDAYLLEFRSAGSSAWTDSLPRTDTSAATIVVSGAIDLHVCALTRAGVTSAFTANLAPGAPTSMTHSGTTLTWTNGAGANQIQVFKSSSNTFSSSTLFATVAAVAGSTTVDDNSYYWIRSVNIAGNISAETGPVMVGMP